MKLIICVDDNNGMMFNRRRQSKDREVRHDILAYTMPERIWMNEYSLEQFETDDTSRIQVANNFLIQADDNDYCFIENGQYLINSSEESILGGLRAFSEGKVPKCNFDPKQYNREAVEEFESAIM